MADRGKAEVAYYDEAEATLDKQPEVYNDFTYDNEADGGIVELLDSVMKKYNDLTDHIQDLYTQYQELQAKYDKFTNFNQSMEDIHARMEASREAMGGRITTIISTAKQALEEHVQEDTSLMDDLEAINDILGIQNDDDWNQSSASFVSGSGVVSDNVSKNPTEGDTSADGSTGAAQTGGGNNAGEAVNDVIAGKYGTGEERKEALKQAGYDPDQVQDLVNRKLKGEDISTYPGETSKEIPATTGPEKAGTISDPGYEVSGTNTTTTTTTTTDTKPADTTTTTNNTTGSKDTGSGTSNLGPLPDPIGDGTSEEAKKTAEMLKSVQ